MNKRSNRRPLTDYYPKSTHKQVGVSLPKKLYIKLMTYIVNTGDTQRGVIIEALERFLE